MSEPAGFKVYADFNCPFCYALSERVWEAGKAEEIEWRCIQHAPSIPVPMPPTASPEDLAELQEEIERLGQRAPEVEARVPVNRPNSGPASMIAARAHLDGDPNLPEFRRLVFRALWAEGEDISNPMVLSRLATQADLAPPQAAADRAQTLLARWQHGWESGAFDRRIPVMVSPGDSFLLGLPESRRVALFLGSGIFSSTYDGTCEGSDQE